MNIVETSGIFDGTLAVVGNFHREKVYRINQYCISKNDLSQEAVARYKGRRVAVKGILRIVKGFYGPTKTSHDGRIYEPLREPDKLFISKPRFTILD